MTLYVLQGRGIFGAASEETLPAPVQIRCAEEVEEVRLDGDVLHCIGDQITLPDSLKDGIHVLKVNGRACEGVYVKKGKVRPAGEDLRRLLPAIFRIYELDLRLHALERKASEKEVYWLK